MPGLLYTPTGWVDDNGTDTVGTEFTAARMNNLEAGVAQATTVLNAGTSWADVRGVAAVSTNLATFGGAGAQIDSQALVNGARYLFANQALSAQNGIYVYGGAAGAWTRATDANDLPSQFLRGRRVSVLLGTMYAGTSWEYGGGSGTPGVDANFRLLVPAKARTLLSEQVLAINNVMTFDNIDQTYTHLELELLIDSTRAGFLNTGMRCWINNDRAGHYHIAGRHNGASSGMNFDVANVNDTWGYVGQMQAAQSGSATPGHEVSLRLPYYSRTDTNFKTVHIATMSADTPGPLGFKGSFLRYGDINTVSRIDIGDDAGGGVRAGSRGRLYGVKE